MIKYAISASLLFFCFLMFDKKVFLDVGFFTIFLPSVLILFAPGYLIYNLLIPDSSKGVLKAVALSFSFSLIVLIIPTVFAYTQHSTIRQVVNFYFLLVALLIFILFILDSFFIKKRGENFNEGAKGNLLIKFALLIILIVFVFLGHYYGGFFSGDAYKHINLIRKITEMPTVEFTDAYIKGINSSSYGWNLWHIALAIISQVAAKDPVVIWIFIATLAAPTIIAALFIFLRRLFKDEKLAFYAILAYVIWFGVMNYQITEGKIFCTWEFALSSWPSFVARDILLYVILFFILDILRKGFRIKDYFVISLLSIVLALIHIYYYYILLFILGSFWLFLLLFNPYQNRKIYSRIFGIMGLVLFPAVFYVIYLTKSLQPALNPRFTDPFNTGRFIPVQPIGKYIMVNPFDGLWQNNMRKLAFIFTPFLILYARRKDWAVYLLALIGVPTLIFLNPFLMTWLQKVNPGLDRIWRLVEIIPYEIIVGLFLYKIAKYFWPHLKSFLAQFRRWQVNLFWLAVIIIGFLFSAKSFYWLMRIHNTAEFHLNFFESAIDRKLINSEMPPGSVILTDQETGCGWATYFPHYIVTCLGFPHLPPNYDPRPAYNDVLKFYSKEKFDEEVKEIIKKYHVNFIVIDKENFLNKDLLNQKDLEFLFETGFEKTEYIPTSGKFFIYKVI